MPCNASYARFIFGKFLTSTIILYVLLFAQKVLFFFCKKWVLHSPTPRAGSPHFLGHVESSLPRLTIGVPKSAGPPPMADVSAPEKAIFPLPDWAVTQQAGPFWVGPTQMWLGEQWSFHLIFERIPSVPPKVMQILNLPLEKFISLPCHCF
jgi:hypothetical protein